MPVLGATPLIALDAVVMDTETTGLDPAKARLLELAAVHIAEGRLDPALTFERRVNPGEPIPEASRRIHGIDDAAVAAMPPFQAIRADYEAFVGDRILIGHTLGFDLAIIRKEYARAGATFEMPRALDTRLLAEIAAPNLAGFSLDKLAAWLGVTADARHSALGDATTTALVFLALIPKLREKGVRTLREAEVACRSLTTVTDGHFQAGWVEVTEAPATRDTEKTLARIDSYPYRHRVRDLMNAPPITAPAAQSLGEGLATMAERRISSLFVVAEGDTPETLDANRTGIVTERDVMRVLAKSGPAALSLTLGAVASRPLATIPADAFVYRAIGRMSRRRIRHLGVVDEEGRVVGALSQRDLLKLRASQAVDLGDEIDDARDEQALGRAWAKLPAVAGSLVAEAVPALDVAAVISRELGALTRRAGLIAEQRMVESGRGDPPCRYAVAVLGSAGRGESLLAMDQDNALVFEAGEPEGETDRWFAAYAGHLADILHAVGVPYCKGGVMAKNPVWRGSVATWRERIETWMTRSRPEDLLAVDIFFDLRPVAGEASLATTLWRHAFDTAAGRTAFAKLLADSSGSVAPAFGLFGGLKTDENGRIDLKRTGLFGIVGAARVLAICHHVVERATPARLKGLGAKGIGGASDLATLTRAHAVLVEAVLEQQLVDIAAGKPPSNAVVPKRLSSDLRARLEQSLRGVGNIETMVADLLFAGQR